MASYTPRSTRASRAAQKPGPCTIANAHGVFEVPGSLKRVHIEKDDDKSEEQKAVETLKLFYVTSKALAWAMRGEKFGSARNPRGSVYGVFETRDAAAEFIAKRGLRLVAAVVHA